MFRSDGNRLYFSGKVSGDVLPVCAALHNLIHKQGYQDIILDLTEATFLDAAFMVPLVSTCRAYRGEHVHFDVVLPEQKRTSNLILNTNWAHLISPEHFEMREFSNRNHLSAVQYLDADQHFSAVDKSLEVILRSVEGLNRAQLKALEWSLNEITDNVLNHAESPIGGIVQVITFAKSQVVEFYVCDAGIGIAKSLRHGRPQIADDVSAVREAIEEGVTRNSATNQGNG